MELPFYNVYVDRMPQGLTAIVATSDLQGVAITLNGDDGHQYEDRYLAHALVEKLSHSLDNHGISKEKTGVLLLGDFHSDLLLKKRGGYGDVRDVWMAFYKSFKWIVGVAGNHDTFAFGSHREFAAFREQANLHLLDGDTVVIDSVKFSGVSGVIGNSKRPWRHRERDHLKMIEEAIKCSPSFLLLHEGPSIHEKGLQGKDEIRQHLEKQAPCTLICGHRHWPGNKIHSLSNGSQIINTEGKVIVFRKKPWQQKQYHF